jgi:TPR repeat protein
MLTSRLLLLAALGLTFATPVAAQEFHWPLAFEELPGSIDVGPLKPSAAPATAADAALDLANRLDGAGGGVSSDAAFTALEDAAAAGQPMALWQLGMMYENGEGVARDPVKAFGYFSRIANDHADTAPRGLEADIVAQSFVKVGEYYAEGLPDAGIPVDERRSHRMIMHAATYFGDADAQYRLGQLYLGDNELGENPLQSARWLSLAARKGHAVAQATLGELLFSGREGLAPQPEEGLMWMFIAQRRVAGTPDEAWVNQLVSDANAAATSDQRETALQWANSLGASFGGL